MPTLYNVILIDNSTHQAVTVFKSLPRDEAQRLGDSLRCVTRNQPEHLCNSRVGVVIDMEQSENIKQQNSY